MKMNEYQQLAQRTANTTTQSDKIHNGLLGLFGEGGELADQIKKTCYQGHELDADHMIEELGDVLWYCAELASGLGVSLEDAALINVEKLKKRYPEGFSAERSINREE